MIMRYVGLIGRRVLLDGAKGPVEMVRKTASEVEKQQAQEAEEECKPAAHLFCETYKVPTDEVLTECFELDWSRTKVKAIVPAPYLPQAKQICRSFYRDVMALWRKSIFIVCMYVCMYVYIYIYIYTYREREREERERERYYIYIYI